MGLLKFIADLLDYLNGKEVIQQPSYKDPECPVCGSKIFNGYWKTSQKKGYAAGTTFTYNHTELIGRCPDSRCSYNNSNNIYSRRRRNFHDNL